MNITCQINEKKRKILSILLSNKENKIKQKDPSLNKPIGPTTYNPNLKYVKSKNRCSSFSNSKTNRKTFEFEKTAYNIMPNRTNPGPGQYQYQAPITPQGYFNKMVHLLFYVMHKLEDYLILNHLFYLALVLTSCIILILKIRIKNISFCKSEDHL